MAVEVDALQLNIGADSTSAAQEVDNLRKSLSGLLQEVRNASALGTLQKQLQGTGKAAATARQRVTASASDWSADRQHWTDSKTGQTYTRQQMRYYVDNKNLGQQLGAKMIPEVYNLSKRMEGALAQDALREEAAAAKHVAQAKREAAQAAKQMAAADKQAKAAAKEAEKASKEHEAALKRLRDAAHSASQHGIGRLVHQFGRMLRMRAVRSAVRGLINAFKEGYHSLYGWSRYMGGDFAAGIDSARNSLATMKNSLATAIAPIIQAALPYIQQFTQWVRNASDTLSQFFAILQGKSTWKRAKDVTADQMAQIEKSAKGAKSSVQEMLASFDELNVIQSESGGAGSGSTPNYAAYKDLFEEVSTFDPGVKKWGEALKEPFQWVMDNLPTIAGGLLSLKLGKDLIKWLGLLGGLFGNGTPTTIPTTPVPTPKTTPVDTTKTDLFGNEVEKVPLRTKIKNKLTEKLTNSYSFLDKLFNGGGSSVNLATNTVAVGDWFTHNTSLGRQSVNALSRLFGGKGVFADEDPLADIKQFGNDLKKNGSTFAYDWETLWMAITGKDDGRLDGQKHYTTIDELLSGYRGELEDNKNSFGNFLKNSYEKPLQDMVTRNHSLLERAGVDAKQVLDNWDLVAPLIDSNGIDESGKRILSLIDTYGTDWISNLDKIGLDAVTMFKGQSRLYTQAGKSLPDALAKGIASDVGYKKSLTDILDAAKVSIGQTAEIVNNTKLTAPIVQTYGYEGSIDTIRKIAATAGNNTKRILENWNLVAPVINQNNMVASMDAINRLISQYGDTWQTHLHELDLKAEVDVKEKTGWFADLKKRISDMLSLNPIAQAIVGVTNSTASSGGSGSGSGSSGGTGGSSGSIMDIFGKDASSYSTARDLLVAMATGGVYGSPFTRTGGFGVKTDKGKENSKKIEVWNLAQDEVDYLKENGFYIPGSAYYHKKTKRGIRQVRQLASGGTVPAGQLFLAREKGAEYVGSMGGSSGAAVANNQQIVQGISQGVENANRTQNDLLREQNSLLRALLRKDTGLKPSAALGRIIAQAEAMYDGVVGV